MDGPSWWRSPRAVPFDRDAAPNSLYGEDIFDIDISPDGRYLTGAISDVSGRQKLVRFQVDQLRKGEAPFQCCTISNTIRTGKLRLFAGPTDDYLYGSSYYTGASNLFRYDVETKKMDVDQQCRD